MGTCLSQKYFYPIFFKHGCISKATTCVQTSSGVYGQRLKLCSEIILCYGNNLAEQDSQLTHTPIIKPTAMDVDPESKRVSLIYPSREIRDMLSTTTH